jgi:uncharacterized membrane protein (DUF441 family)
MFGAKQRDFARQRLMPLAMMAALLVGILLAVLSLDGGGAGLRSEVPGPVLGVVVMTTMVAAIYRIVPNRTFTRHRSCPERCSPAS